LIWCRSGLTDFHFKLRIAVIAGKGIRAEWKFLFNFLSLQDDFCCAN